MAKPNSKKPKRLDSTPSSSATGTTVGKRTLTQEEKARIIRDRLANRPVFVFRYPNGKLNRRFVFMLALFVIALIAALFFLSRL